MSTLFISDLHLSSDQPEITQLFLDFLHQQAREADALYILGDLFETWVGDDNLGPYNQMIISELADLTARGIATYFMPGNRDFLIGKRFIQQTGCHYLADPTIINLYGNSTLLTHGDSWCTLDKHYLRYRRWSRYPFWQFLFLQLPLPWRQKVAKYLRGQEHSNTPIAMAKYDVVISDLLAYLQHHPGTNQIIHGHTHLPSIQLIKSTENIWIRRFVLSDWHANRANVLVALPNQTLTLMYFSQGKDRMLSNFSHED
ncbi:UDP-2,3-diacylglucosamine diphosphatase [Rickettsiella endosymbiont of Rhagonycha lignosa]|uniref:UDP-2,3-diacylglucosamine diphosphatase n=1 Tax=Rickettsiella endosymbiont of Rhagonycha lignosa TaxID=3077937 RepID=UPI00313BB6BA